MKLFPSISRSGAASHTQRTWSVRALILAVVIAVVPLSQAHAGVFISVSVAPPPLVVYEQPPCPEPDLIWSPGYWAYDYDAASYYWVPGAWVPAPYEGALWTPPYWGWEDGIYMFHPGYWGTEVGYYGGVNYGYGYMGVGFVGGRWDNDHFAYNTAVMRVNQTVINNTYVNNTIVQQNTIINNNHVAYTGGPNGVHHEPTPQERQAMAAPHQPPTQYQQQHIQAARTERGNFYNANHGHPQQVALARPLPAAHYQPPAAHAGAQVNATGRPGNVNGNVNGNAGVNARPGSVNNNAGARGESRPNNQPARPTLNNQPARQMPNNEPARPMPNNQPAARPAPAPEARPDNRPAPQPRPQYQPEQPQRPSPESRPAPQQPRPESRPAPEYRPAPQQQPRQESRPAPEYRPAPQQQPRQESRPAPEYRPAPQQQPRQESRPAPEYRPAPQQQPHQESRPAPPPREQSRPAPQQRPEPNPKEPRR